MSSPDRPRTRTAEPDKRALKKAKQPTANNSPVKKLRKLPDEDFASTANKKELFLGSFKRSNCNIGMSCEAVGITRRTYNRWRLDDQDFSDTLYEIEQGYVDNLISLHDKICMEDRDTRQLWKRIQAKSEDDDFRRPLRQELSSPDGKSISVKHGIDMEWLNEELPVNALVSIVNKLRTNVG